MLGDLHTHSEYSQVAYSSYRYGRILGPFKRLVGDFKSPRIEAILPKAAAVGLRIIAITDHDETEGAFKAQKMADRYGLLVIPGIEISTSGGHVLGYGLKKPVFVSKSRELSLSEALELIHEQGGVAAAAHPFYHSWLQLSVTREALAGKSFDAVETFNASTTNKKYRREAKRLAGQLSLGEVGGTDAHTSEFIGYGVTEFSDKVASLSEALEEIRQGKTKAFGRDVSHFGFLRSLAVENLKSRLTPLL